MYIYIYKAILYIYIYIYIYYPLVNIHSYGKWPFLGDFPIEHGDFL